MKKLFYLAAFIVFGISTVYSQQLPLYSQYMMNGFLLNPAMAGTVSYMPVCLTARQQWAGIKGAPQTIALSGHTLLGRAEGVGGYLFNDNFGPIMRTGMLASYAHHIRIGSKQKLALGVSLSAFQYTLDETKLILEDQTPDGAFSNNKETSFIPDANFGMYFYGEDKYFAGLSVAQLFQWNIKVGTTNENKLVRHYFLLGGYKFDINKDFKVEPSILVKATESAPVQMDLNCKGYYKKSYWFGISYRTDKSVIAMIGMKYNIYYIGYAYDYTLSKISNYTNGSHEIVIGVNIGEKENRGSSLL